MAGQALESFVVSGQGKQMEALLVSTGIVALAEIGDKTQLLAFILAAKFRRPLPIVFGILIATLVNHGFAGAVGAWITSLLGPEALRWVLGISFLAMAAWTLIPDEFDEEDAKLARFGVFGTTLVAFFLGLQVIPLDEKDPHKLIDIIAALDDLKNLLAAYRSGQIKERK